MNLEAKERAPGPGPLDNPGVKARSGWPLSPETSSYPVSPSVERIFNHYCFRTVLRINSDEMFNIANPFCLLRSVHGQKKTLHVLNRQLTTEAIDSTGDDKRLCMGRLSLHGQGMLFRSTEMGENEVKKKKKKRRIHVQRQKDEMALTC